MFTPRNEGVSIAAVFLWRNVTDHGEYAGSWPLTCIQTLQHQSFHLHVRFATSVALNCCCRKLLNQQRKPRLFRIQDTVEKTIKLLPDYLTL